MLITDAFVVAAPVEAAWALLQDVPAVSSCLPGAELTEDLGGGEYRGRFGVRLGPIGLGLDGRATIEADATTRRGVIRGEGIDRRGGSRGRIAVTYTLSEVPEGTKVDIETDLTLSGPAAQFGRTGIVKQVARKLMLDFARCLEQKLRSASPSGGGGPQTG